MRHCGIKQLVMPCGENDLGTWAYASSSPSSSLRKIVNGPTNREQGRCARSTGELLPSGSARPMAVRVYDCCCCCCFCCCWLAMSSPVRKATGMMTAWSISIHNQTCKLSLKGLRSSVIRASSRADRPQWGTSWGPINFLAFGDDPGRVDWYSTQCPGSIIGAPAE